MGPTITVIPTLGFNVNSVENDKVVVNAFDVGGDDKFRPLCQMYYEQANVIMFVVDVSISNNGVEHAVDEFHRLICVR